LEYTLLQSLTDKSLFVFYERYADEAAFDFHRTTEYYKALGTKTVGLTSDPVKVLRLGQII
jgi:quinol monooxygenase YgiN